MLESLQTPHKVLDIPRNRVPLRGCNDGDINDQSLQSLADRVECRLQDIAIKILLYTIVVHQFALEVFELRRRGEESLQNVLVYDPMSESQLFDVRVGG